MENSNNDQKTFPTWFAVVTSEEEKQAKIVSTDSQKEETIDTLKGEGFKVLFSSIYYSRAKAYLIKRAVENRAAAARRIKASQAKKAKKASEKEKLEAKPQPVKIFGWLK